MLTLLTLLDVITLTLILIFVRILLKTHPLTFMVISHDNCRIYMMNFDLAYKFAVSLNSAWSQSKKLEALESDFTTSPLSIMLMM